jgi:hypothetical protein
VSNFDKAESHEADLIAEGLAKALTISDDTSPEKAYWRVVSHLEQFLDRQMALITPSLRKQWKLLADKRAADKRAAAETDVDKKAAAEDEAAKKKGAQYLGGDQLDPQGAIPHNSATDILSNLNELRASTSDPLDCAILDQGLAADNESLAAEFGLTEQSIRRRRTALFEKYQAL